MVAAVLEHLRQSEIRCANGEELDNCPYEVGGPAQVKTTTGWADCTVTDIREDGAMQIDITGDYYWAPALAQTKLRPVEDDDEPPTTVTNEEIDDSEETEEPTGGVVRAIVMWNDFNWEPLVSQRWGPLDTEAGGELMKSILADCGVEDVTEISRQQCTPEAVNSAIYQVGQRCDENDIFVFYYTGHGDKLPDRTGDEADGFDEAICTVRGGMCTQQTWLRDDDFSNYITSYVKAKHIIVLMDCCHSGTVCDMAKKQWRHKNAMSISGCADSEVSAGTGQGGLLSHSLRQAVSALAGQENVSGAMFYNTVVQCAAPMKEQFGSGQNITVQCPPHSHPAAFRWPLIMG
eukprot:TRINITY_DN11640_c0_g1_i4.p1 TRINITY_DN11640_c0_g1~~TRINITY_DN11640_c0_g1_i4.p1  ORF type:complete len:398 (-),score=78.61 TRINITY_DN11640_c0_g1_i4:248-1288(-)